MQDRTANGKPPQPQAKSPAGIWCFATSLHRYKLNIEYILFRQTSSTPTTIHFVFFFIIHIAAIANPYQKMNETISNYKTHSIHKNIFNTMKTKEKKKIKGKFFVFYGFYICYPPRRQFIQMSVL